MPYGGSNRPIDPSRHAAFEEQVRALREVPMEELENSFSLDDILAIEQHQKESSIGTLRSMPLPVEIIDSKGSAAGLLAANTTTYDEEGEDLLFEDAILRKIVQARSAESGNTDLAALLRTRRSVVTFLLHHVDELISDTRQLRRPA